MAVAYYSEFPQGSSEVAQQVAERVNQQIGPEGPDGGIYHAEGPRGDGGWWTFNVWESEDAAQRFFRDTLMPILQDVGVGRPDSQPRMLNVHWESNSRLQS
jgi:hypothetical protein